MSKLGVMFDSLQNGKMMMPISATIVSLTQAQSSASLNDSSADIMGSSSTNTTARSSGSSNSGGGLLGGVTNTVGNVVNTTTNTVGGVTNNVGQTVGNTTNTLAERSRESKFRNLLTFQPKEVQRFHYKAVIYIWKKEQPLICG